MNVGEERIDVFCSGRTVVHLIRVLVHVHDEQREGSGDDLRMVPRPECVQPVAMEIPRRDDPSTAAAEARTGCTEELLPSTDPAVDIGERLLDRPIQATFAAEVLEVELVERC